MKVKEVKSIQGLSPDLPHDLDLGQDQGLGLQGTPPDRVPGPGTPDPTPGVAPGLDHIAEENVQDQEKGDETDLTLVLARQALITEKGELKFYLILCSVLFQFLYGNHSQESKIAKVISNMLDDMTKNSLKNLLSSSSNMAAIVNHQ